MKLIYSMAKEVIAWIGPTSTDSSQAMTVLRKILLVTGTISKHSRESHFEDDEHRRGAKGSEPTRVMSNTQRHTALKKPLRKSHAR